MSLSKEIFERRMHVNRKWSFFIFRRWFLPKVWTNRLYFRLFIIKTLRNANLVASLPVDVRRSKTPLLIGGTQREYSSKPLKHSIVKRILKFNS